ncbi:uncharacterized protein TrAFT101_000050 [Trichoderma asperellum]|uniref:uncharacterized protein n=1 Tax=Trichoderma asperellum TaxID=101201 RepID=UPI003320B229|nr:hypothetical protein TrAFT101_000050 [Trichoderma asperellum]
MKELQVLPPSSSYTPPKAPEGLYHSGPGVCWVGYPLIGDWCSYGTCRRPSAPSSSRNSNGRMCRISI